MPTARAPTARMSPTMARNPFSCASFHSPVQPWVMRPSGVTPLASTMTRPAPVVASQPRCWRCQAVGAPSSALYWHIGDTAMRLASASGPRRMGEKSALLMWAESSTEEDEGDEHEARHENAARPSHVTEEARHLDAIFLGDRLDHEVRRVAD